MWSAHCVISQCRPYLPDLLNRGAAVGAGGLSNASSILVSLDGALLIANNHIYTTCSLARESKAKNRMGQQLDGSIGRWKVVLISSKIIFRYNKSINTGFKYIKLSPYLVSASVKCRDNNVCKGIIYMFVKQLLSLLNNWYVCCSLFADVSPLKIQPNVLLGNYWQ